MRKRISLLIAALMMALTMSFSGVAFAAAGGGGGGNPGGGGTGGTLTGGNGGNGGNGGSIDLAGHACQGHNNCGSIDTSGGSGGNGGSVTSP